MTTGGVGVAVCVAAVLVGLAVISLRRRFIVVLVDGLSMAPTLRPGDRVLVRRQPAHAVRRGQLVVVTEPGPCRPGDPTGSHGSRLMIKRVAAVAGDPQPSFLPEWSRGPTGIVEPGRLVLLGDNTALSRDSRHVGTVAAERVLGVVIRRHARGSARAASGVDDRPV